MSLTTHDLLGAASCDIGNTNEMSKLHNYLTLRLRVFEAAVVLLKEKTEHKEIVWYLSKHILLMFYCCKDDSKQVIYFNASPFHHFSCIIMSSNSLYK